MSTRQGTARLRGLPPIEAPGAHVLVLGSMPGAASLAAGQYYAHPRNGFWGIIGTVTGAAASRPYAHRVAALRAAGIALWDVVASCQRRGSLDAAIDRRSIEINDFATFLAQHAQIDRVLFNGAMAEALFRRRVLHTLGGRAPKLLRLPSTSPAHAGLHGDRKRQLWQRALTAASTAADTEAP